MKKLLIAICLLLATPAVAQGPITIAPQVTTTITSNLVAKAYPGFLYGFVGTTGSTAGCFFVFDATSLPGNGSVTPALAPIEAGANTTVALSFAPSPPAYFSTGIVIGFSSTCGLTLTASSTALISAMVQ